MISVADFFIFQNFDIWGFCGGKRAKNDPKLPISVCFALCISGTVDHIIKILIMILQVFFFIFFKMQHGILKLFCFLLPHFKSFLIIICFSSSSINVPHLLHMCVIFNKLIKVQNKAFRLINFQPSNTPIGPLYHAKKLKIGDFINYRNALFAQNILRKENYLMKCWIC